MGRTTMLNPVSGYSKTNKGWPEMGENTAGDDGQQGLGDEA
jgi:hypothetical protein